MIRYLSLLAVVFLAFPALAVDEELSEESVRKNNPGTKIYNAINKRIDKALADSEYCSDHPNEKKCIDREKAQHDKDMRDMKSANEALKELDQNPELKKLVERNMAGKEVVDPGVRERSQRKEFLNNIKEMCKEAGSEECKMAKKDYEEWKADR